MAQTIQVELICDAGHTEHPALRTTSFGFESNEGMRRDFQIELCASHLAEFMEALDPWIARGRAKTSARSRSAMRAVSPPETSVPALRETSGRRPARRDPEQLVGIRIWARAHGLEVGDKGRIPAEIEEAYNRRGDCYTSPSVGQTLLPDARSS